LRWKRRHAFCVGMFRAIARNTMIFKKLESLLKMTKKSLTCWRVFSNSSSVTHSTRNQMCSSSVERVAMASDACSRLVKPHTQHTQHTHTHTHTRTHTHTHSHSTLLHKCTQITFGEPAFESDELEVDRKVPSAGTGWPTRKFHPQGKAVPSRSRV
jgi:hypothetical protein